jgi:hypothetical protein
MVDARISRLPASNSDMAVGLTPVAMASCDCVMPRMARIARSFSGVSMASIVSFSFRANKYRQRVA